MIGGAALALLVMAQQQWPQHSMDRPRPPVVDPGPARAPAPAPKDAIVLFDGSSLSQWRAHDSTAAKWIVRDGYMEVKPGTGTLVSTRGFGDVQLHIEWATPAIVQGEGQERGNSGIFLMGRYELQVLDSYQNDTYPDGQAGAIYGENPPLVNATRPPGQWQEYDIVFRRPRFKADGSLERPARMTVFLNGVLIQDNFELVGPTANKAQPPYRAHADKLPLTLQDHGNPTRFRNIWIRELKGE
jgi:3-keto-disaccharide hydrolase